VQFSVDDETGQAESELEDLRNRYSVVRDSGEARELRSRIKTAQTELVRLQIEQRTKELDTNLKDLLAKVEQIRRVGSPPREVARAERAAAALIESRELLDRVGGRLSPDAPFKSRSCGRSSSPRCLKLAGFDIVIANRRTCGRRSLLPRTSRLTR